MKPASINLAVIILAAGESRRMGFPKLSARIEDIPLLAHVIHTAQTVSDDILVVVGAYPDIYGPLAEDAGARVVLNADWREGLGSSLAAGVRALAKDVDAAIVMLADQPFVPAEHLRLLVQQHAETAAELVFSAYEGIMGPPVLLQRSVMMAASALKGDSGAKKLIREGMVVAEVTLAAYQDIDRPEDLASY